MMGASPRCCETPTPPHLQAGRQSSQGSHLFGSWLVVVGMNTQFSSLGAHADSEV